VNPATLYETLLRWLDETRQDARPAPAAASATPPAPAIPSSAGALDDIAGLDAVRGLSLFAGQRALYMQALGYFVDLYDDGLAAVDRYVAGAPGATREAVGRDVHSMGGAAAALGAIELEEAAHRIDRMMRGDPARPADDAQLRPELGRLRDDLATLVAGLRGALGRGSKPT